MCKIIHRDGFIWKHGTKTNIELNQNTHVNMYTQGKQYASTQWVGNQLKRTGEIVRIDDIDVNNGISYEEDEWLIQETTLISDGENMKDANNNRIRKCKPGS